VLLAGSAAHGTSAMSRRMSAVAATPGRMPSHDVRGASNSPPSWPSRACALSDATTAPAISATDGPSSPATSPAMTTSSSRRPAAAQPSAGPNASAPSAQASDARDALRALRTRARR
jgi:hypothetical protein